MNLRRRLAVIGALATCAAASAIRAGHDDVQVDPALRRSPGKVTGLGRPDDQGRIFSFQAKPLRAAAYVPDELRGWRLTVLAGKRFASVFEVQSNTESHITVAPADGPLNGVAVNDLFIAEEIAIERSPGKAAAAQ